MPDLPEYERDALAAVIRQLRSREGRTQEEVADAAGLNRKWIGDVERGRHRPSFDGVVLTVRALGVTMAEFGELYETEVARRRKGHR